MILLHLLTLDTSHSQSNSSFHVQLSLDFLSAERTLELYEGTSGSPQSVAQLRGSQLALEATALLSGQHLKTPDLEAKLRDAKYGQLAGDDVFRIREARENTADIKELLAEIKRRNFGQRVASTVAQLFPSDARISSTIPVFFVAFGHQNISAFVQSIAWKDDRPVVVGEGEGQLTIVVNLSRTVYYGDDLNERFIGTLSVVAHEVFHAAFGVYQNQSPIWQSYFDTHRTYLDRLLELTQNEGIAHYLSFEQRGGHFPRDWNKRVTTSFEEFNTNAGELLSRSVSPQRAGEIIRASNTSEYWESYGAITGLFIAMTIDRELGREALTSTVSGGPFTFFGKYVSLTKSNTNLPRLSKSIQQRLLHE